MREVVGIQLAQDRCHWPQTSNGARLKPSPSSSVPSMDIVLADRDTVLDVTERCSAEILHEDKVGECLQKEGA
jgi:hypothetical protein